MYVNKLPLNPGGAHFVGDTLNVIRAHPLVGEYEHKAVWVQYVDAYSTLHLLISLI